MTIKMDWNMTEGEEVDFGFLASGISKVAKDGDQAFFSEDDKKWKYIIEGERMTAKQAFNNLTIKKNATKETAKEYLLKLKRESKDVVLK